MTGSLVPSQKASALSQSSVSGHLQLPTMIFRAGPDASDRYVDFFTATIRNASTREAYARQCRELFFWLTANGVKGITEIRPVHIAAYIEMMDTAVRPSGKRRWQPASVKQALAAIRNCFSYLVTGHIIETNPAQDVKGPSVNRRIGKTPVLVDKEARRLLDSIDPIRPIGHRDRALIGIMVFSFSRISAALSCRVEDFEDRGNGNWFIKLYEKRGKESDIPVHHLLQNLLLTYLDAANIANDREGLIFRAAIDRRGNLSDRPFSRQDAWEMVKRRAAAASISQNISPHTFRATGITRYIEAGGAIETAQDMAGHVDTSTTRLYDRSSRTVARAEVERIRL